MLLKDETLTLLSQVKPLCMPLRHMVQWRYSSTYF